MDKSLFRYIWRHSKRDQLIIFAVVLASLPFYFASLDLPRRIVNEAIQGKSFAKGNETAPFLQISFTLPDWLGGAAFNLFGGFQVDRLTLLYGLSGLFLFFVLVNGAFKYWINVEKGALGERMLRRMRFDLFALVLRFTPEALRNVKSSETATIIKDEVEPIGGFIGDAFILPMFLGTQAATALIFIMVQNVWLGLLAGGVVGIQFTIIPRLRRELLRLGKQRQLASRRLAGRVGEVVDGMEAVHVHNTDKWERAEIGHRLFELFDLRFRIYKRKFMVKFLNNLLAQMTPFFFYAIGGYFALRGRLDIGQLVAVIAAYRELPPPLKELIDWDQQRLDVQVKYDQVVQHFSPERLLPPPDEAAAERDEGPLEGPLVVKDLTVSDPHGGEIIDGASLTCPLPVHAGIVGDGGPAAGAFARILGRRSVEYAGEVRIGERNLADLPRGTVGRHIAYAGVEPILFPGSIRDNLVYGLRHHPIGDPEEDARERARRIAEAKRTGNPVETVTAPWIDCSLAGASDEDDLDRILIEFLERVGLKDDIYRFGLSGMLDPDKDPELAGRLIEARNRLRERLASSGMAELVEPFDAGRYNHQATVGENLLFGVPTSRALMGRNLAEHGPFREALKAEAVDGDLAAMGAQIAETMVEIFRGLPAGHPLFEQFSFVAADELPEYEAILRRHARRAGDGSKGQDSKNRDFRGQDFKGPELTRLLSLPLAYIEPRHRLGLLNEELEARLVKARRTVRERLGREGDPGVEFYDAEKVCAAAPLKDNLLFGRVSHSAANAQSRVTEAITGVIDEMGLRPGIERVGLMHQVGPAGRLLTAQQRASVNLVRCLVKRPDLLVVDGALAPFGEAQRRGLVSLLHDVTEGRSLFMVLPNDRETEGCKALIRFQKGKAVLEERERAPEPESESKPEAHPQVEEEAEAVEPVGKRVAGGVA
ncbi:MAG TPA: ABC transporter ATP-binding protein [Beijerinckiaceae bacterium]|jgi:putative ABC transport system ATP-binding protein